MPQSELTIHSFRNGGHGCDALIDKQLAQLRPLLQVSVRAVAGKDMCGIVGIFGDAARDTRLLSCMAAAIGHRGPDDQGTWNDPDAGIALANRRLAIIDLSPAGHQPMQSSDGRLMLTFNGEIYNHGELRRELETAGRVPLGGWRGHSDTETFLEAISAWGIEDALQRSVGMFAFAVWDRHLRSLTLARDRFGEKPLYYGWAGKDFVFASELKAIRLHPDFDPSIHRGALGLYVARNYIPAPLSIYRRIYKLPPGCLIQIDPGARPIPVDDLPGPGYSSPGLTISQYWSYRDVIRSGLRQPISDETEAVEQLEKGLARAVGCQSVTDVPIGAFLSGGIDSSTIVSLYQKYSSQQVRTFTIGFAEDAFNEADYARAVARHLGTDHHERRVTAADAREVIPDLPRIYDEPFADSSQIPTYLVSKFAREQVTVALSGDGGDELFGGYNRYFAATRAWSTLSLLPRPLRASAGVLLSRLPANGWNRVGGLVGGRQLPPYFGEKVRKWLRTIAGARDIDQLFATFLDEWAGEPSPVRGTGGADLCPFDLNIGMDAPDALRMMYCDATSYLPDDILCKVDRASMAVSLEVHVPFLDHRVAELAARIPIGMKIRGGTGKNVLRQLLYREVPAHLFDRPKTGFGIPVGEWLKGPLRAWAEEMLDRSHMAEEGWFDAEAVHRRWLDHVSGRRDSTAAIWAVLMFQAWLLEQKSLPVRPDLRTAAAADN